MSAIIDNFASRTFKDHGYDLEPIEAPHRCNCGHTIQRGELCAMYWETIDNGLGYDTQYDVMCLGCHHDSKQ